MTARLGSCAECGSEAVRTLAAAAYCAACAENILGPIRERTFPTPGSGHGRSITPRPDWGPTWHGLECDECSATWTGPINETCAYRAVRLEQQRHAQSELLLYPHPEPATCDQLRAWTERLARGIETGLIDRHHADRALSKRAPR